MNKSQFIEALAAHYEGNKKQASQALETVLETITREVSKGEKVAITGFGAFEKVVKPSRMVRNPATGERVRVKKTAVPKFRPGADLKAVVSGAKKLPKVAKKVAAKKTVAPAKKTTPAKKATAKKTTAKKTTPAKKATAKKTTAKKATPAKKATAKKTTAKKATPAKKTAKKATPAKKATAKKTTAKKATPAKKTAKKTAKRS